MFSLSRGMLAKTDTGNSKGVLECALPLDMYIIASSSSDPLGGKWSAERRVLEVLVLRNTNVFYSTKVFDFYQSEKNTRGIDKT